MIARAESRIAGVAWSTLSPRQQGRFTALAQFMFQALDPPEWLLSAMQEDDQLLASVYVVLEGHVHRYFRGDGGEGQKGQDERVLVVHIPRLHVDPARA